MTKYKNKQTRREKRLAVRQWLFSASFRAILLTALMIFSVLYIIQMNSISTKGFDISNLQNDIQTLKYQTRALEVQIAEKRSMASIQERIKGMNLVASTDVKYVIPVGTTVAIR
ncbi:MAG: hypothetical protein WC862_03090 [Patescibacteria group bacterium]